MPQNQPRSLKSSGRKTLTHQPPEGLWHVSTIVPKVMVVRSRSVFWVRLVFLRLVRGGLGPNLMWRWLTKRVRVRSRENRSRLLGLRQVFPLVAMFRRRLGFGAQRYRGGNGCGRCFRWLKQWYGLSTRFGDYAVIHPTAVELCAVAIWLTLY